MQMHYLCGLNSMLTCLGGSGPGWTKRRLPVGMGFGTMLKAPICCHPEGSGSPVACGSPERHEWELFNPLQMRL
jgi:hypothetical protein